MNIEMLTASALQYLPDNYFSTSNLEITFTTGSGTFIADPETGNYIQQPGTPIIITASVSEDEDSVNQPIPGSQGVAVLNLKGRFVSPKLIPATVRLDSIGTAKLTNNDGLIVSGTWKFTTIIQNRINSYTAKRGTFFKGTITTGSAV